MKNTQALVEGFVKPSRGRGVKRDDLAYEQALETTTIELERLLDIYRTTVFVEDMRARLYRDSIDHWIRRYHGYAIEGKIKSHYREIGVDEKDSVFEHVLPASSVVDMLIQDRLTINQALNTPTCLIKKSSDLVLKDNGLTKQSPDNWRFFRRYSVLNSSFVTYDGKPIDNINDWTLDNHWNLFGVTP
jgi:hypothetical protein